VIGLMNVQFAIKDGDLYVLEVKPPRFTDGCRSSRRPLAFHSPSSRRK